MENIESAHYGMEQEKKRDVVGIRKGRVRDKIRGGYIESLFSTEFRAYAPFLLHVWLGNL